MVPLLCDAEITHDALPDSGTMPVYLALATAHERTAHSLDTQILNVVPLAADASDARMQGFQAAIDSVECFAVVWPLRFITHGVETRIVGFHDN